MSIMSYNQVFPLEILVMIGQQLPLPEPYITSIDYPINEDTIASIITLQNYAYTCRALYNEFSHLLHRFVVLDKGLDIVRLLTVFLRNPAACQQTRHIFCRAELGKDLGESVPDFQMIHVKELKSIISSALTDEQSDEDRCRALTRMEEALSQESLPCVFLYMLTLLPNVETLFLQDDVFGQTVLTYDTISSIVNLATIFKTLRKLILDGVHGDFTAWTDANGWNWESGTLKEFYIRSWRGKRDSRLPGDVVLRSLRLFLHHFQVLSVLGVEFHGDSGPEFELVRHFVLAEYQHDLMDVLRLKNCLFPITILQRALWASFRHIIVEECKDMSQVPDEDEFAEATIGVLGTGGIRRAIEDGLEGIQVNRSCFGFENVTDESFSIVHTDMEDVRKGVLR